MGKAIEELIDIHSTIRTLEKKLAVEPDPRKRHDIAQTLDLLESSLDVVVDKLAREKKQPA